MSGTRDRNGSQGAWRPHLPNSGGRFCSQIFRGKTLDVPLLGRSEGVLGITTADGPLYPPRPPSNEDQSCKLTQSFELGRHSRTLATCVTGELGEGKSLRGYKTAEKQGVSEGSDHFLILQGSGGQVLPTDLASGEQRRCCGCELAGAKSVARSQHGRQASAVRPRRPSFLTLPDAQAL